MTVIKCLVCDMTQVTASPKKSGDYVVCPFCGKEGIVWLHRKGKFKGEGIA